VTSAHPSRAFRRWAVTTVVVTYLLIVVGGIVRVSGSGEGCGSGDGTGSWPLCRGGLVPPADLQTVIEFSHRILAILSGIGVTTVMIWALLRYRSIGRVVAWTVVAQVLWIMQIVLGAVVVQFHLPANAILIHLANAELVLGATAVVALLAATSGSDRRISWSTPGARARLGAGIAVATFVLVVSGAYLVDSGASAACNGWPLCGTGGGVGSSLASKGPDFINLLHRFVAGFVVLFIGAAVPQIARAHRGEPWIRPTVTAVYVFILLQIIAGALVVELRLPAWTTGLHLALASAVWLSVVVMAVLSRVRVDRDPVGAGNGFGCAIDCVAVR
jgi:heme A synthase